MPLDNWWVTSQSVDTVSKVHSLRYRRLNESAQSNILTSTNTHQTFTYVKLFRHSEAGFAVSIPRGDIFNFGYSGGHFVAAPRKAI